MYKSMTLLVLVALAACVVSMEAQDQEAAEQYYSIYGVYPSWYTYGATAFNGVRNYPYPYYPTGFPFATYPNTVVKTYPTAATSVKNVATTYPVYPFGFGFNPYPYAAPYGAAPYAAAAPVETPVKA
ncbi:uncharacterized protein LOC130698484 [Daphnia carinata]|uniref:uncharacterized protein LOC130698484 n=1 Tax=Daphnia carinata TaxID=120202 RepID=UPI00257AC78D|nr:uncharacterized protein LOC130698484 [Daphnia carinata]